MTARWLARLENVRANIQEMLTNSFPLKNNYFFSTSKNKK
jgi:hypothetical protein